jgi:hypothetical protein
MQTAESALPAKLCCKKEIHSVRDGNIIKLDIDKVHVELCLPALSTSQQYFSHITN